MITEVRVRTISVPERRRAMVRRHHLAGDASGPEAATRAMIALHATDPASVYLSVLARSAASTLADVAEAMYGRRHLVRWMAMRRTLFVFRRQDIPMIQAAVSTPLAATLRTRLVRQLERNGTEPPIDGDVPVWLDRLAARAERALDQRGTATGAELSRDEPGLATSILVRAPSDRPQNVTASLLTLMSAQGRIVRGTPTGAWTSRHHRWEPAGRWWPDGLPTPDPGEAQQALARRWLARFGPATAEDLQWWTGWNKTTTHRALSHLPVTEIDLHGRPGIILTELDDEPGDA
ncbi:MAG TPA: crosslink repair DNA glycosylase YcaQ family protein, partial [Streptosporangiaceae bacterium]